jgi:hypothetical protein
MADSTYEAKVFFYAVYQMGVHNGIIEPLDEIDTPDLGNDLSDDDRALAESIRDMDIDQESPPENVEMFYRLARSIVRGSFTEN